MVARRLVVGAHYGLRDWLAQRITAVVMAAYSLGLLFVLARRPPASFEAWTALFGAGWMRIATLLFAVSLAWHAWVGARDILMDYIKHDGLRLALQVATVLLLAGYLGWAIEILWR
jgi:succinate dehydrogenase / fumarate reductase membrane anchor subunit